MVGYSLAEQALIVRLQSRRWFDQIRVRSLESCSGESVTFSGQADDKR